MNPDKLINQLSLDTGIRPLKAPAYYALVMIVILVVYGVITQSILGIRADLGVQLGRPAFVIEIALLLLLTLTSLGAAVLSLYPDFYQKRELKNLPFIVFIVLVCFIAVQIFLPDQPGMVYPQMAGHGLKGVNCTLCIAAVALLPAALFMALLRKGASTNPVQAGAYAALAASGIGCLTLRLAEKLDALTHLVQWHYCPTLVFALAGAWLGKYILRW